NLRIFYQHRVLWCFYAWVALVSTPVVLLAIGRAPPHPGLCARVLVVSLIMGIAAAALQHEILVRPFSFLLPGHRHMPRRVLTMVGLLVTLPLGLVALRCAVPDALTGWLAVAALASLALAVYSLAVAASLPRRVMNPIIGFLPLILTGLSLLDLPVAIEWAVLNNPTWVILGSLIASLLAWRSLGDEGLARRLCGSRSLALFESFDLRKAQEYRRQAFAERLSKTGDQGTPTWREGFFLARMDASRPHRTGRAAWGALYERFGVYPPRTILQMTASMAMVLPFGYGASLGTVSLANIAYVAASLATFHAVLPASYTVPLPLSRRQRFLATLAGLAGLALVILALLALLCLASHLLAPHLSPIVFKGMTMPYRAMSPGGLGLALLLTPIGAVTRIFVRGNFLRLLPMMIVLMTYWVWMPPYLALPAATQALATAAAWAATTALLAWHCHHRDLLTE
ncbi:MAG: hypothetical protein GX657_16165, partial [Chloroflexi bacterium]|nr:hypothetical protein [Chloroflexota bacterium]